MKQATDGQNVDRGAENPDGQQIENFRETVTLADGCTTIAISIESVAGRLGIPRASLVAYRFYDEGDRVLEPVGNYSNSEQLGPFFYLENTKDETPSRTTKTIEVPDGARRCELAGHAWKKGISTTLLSRPFIQRQGDSQNTEFGYFNGEIIPVLAGDYVGTYLADTASREISVSFRFRRQQGTGVAKALVLVEFLGSDGELLPPTGELAVNPQYGPFVYLECNAGPDVAELTTTLRLPFDCSSVRLRGQDWTSDQIVLTEEPSVVLFSTADLDSTEISLAAFVEQIPADENLIVVYTTARSIGNSTLLLRSNRLALEYAAAGNWVIFFPFGSLDHDENPRPHERLLQVERTQFKTFMDAAVNRKGRHNKFICSSFTDLQVVSSIDRMRDNGWAVIYEVRDDMEEFNRVGYSKWYNPLIEARVAKRADAVVAVSPRLQEKIETISGRSDVQLVPNGAPDALVKTAAYLRTQESISLRKDSRKVGYIGHLTPSWFDWELVLQVANRLPQVEFEIIGHEFPDGLSLPINVTYLGSMPHADCIAYAETWRAGLIPFKISPLTYGVDPNKIYEYVALGLRTVSAPMGSVESIPGTWVYTTVDSAVEGVLDAVTRPITDSELNAFDSYIVNNTWSKRAADMLTLLEGA
ncbi:hypothetical protein IWX64_003383 [Arthrobacter sp. CAN_A212]|uniref:hypothetical protein n=1 Tax=Arthrobacter sp. CAN_A212 TaxID=2787719 RepID=UPI0018CAE056